MRWTISCTLWVTIVAVITASEENEARPKRDIALIKNFITTKLFGSEQVPTPPNYRLFRIPGFDNILVKAVPKANIQETPLVLEDVNPSIAILNSYLGTSSANETYKALEGVHTLLQSGVLTDEVDIPYHVPLDIPHIAEPVVMQPEVLDVPTVSYRVPIPYMPLVGKLYKPVNIPIPELAYPTKYSYKQLHRDSVTSYKSNDNNNVVVTESKVTVPLPPYLSNRFQQVLAIGINRVPLAPMQVVSPIHNIPVNPYDPARTTPTLIDGNFSYKHIHQDGSMSTFTGTGEGFEKPTLNPGLVNISETPKDLTKPYVPTTAPIIVPTNYSYKHIHNDGTMAFTTGEEEKKVTEKPSIVREEIRPIPLLGFFSGRIANVAAKAHNWSSPSAIQHETAYTAPMPHQDATPFTATNIPAALPLNSYKHLHNDGSVTAYLGGDVVEKISRPILPPSYFINSFENVAATGYGLPSTTVIGGPAASLVYQRPISYTPTEPTNYSYKHVHNDGTVTAYSDANVVQHNHGRPGIVLEETRRPILPPSYFTNGNSGPKLSHPAFIRPAYGTEIPVYQGPPPFVAVPPQVGNTGYSYQHIHNDGTATAYSGVGVVEQRPSVLVQEVRRPFLLPSFFANRIETVATTANRLPHAVMAKPSFGPAIPVYQDSYPILMEHLTSSFPKPLDPHFNDEVKVNYTGPGTDIPSGYSYKTVHRDGSSTVQLGSGLIQESNNGYISKVTDIKEARNNQTNGKVDAQTQTGEYFYTTVHNDRTVTTPSGKETKELDANKQSFVQSRKSLVLSGISENDRNSYSSNEAVITPVLVPKPIVTSQYTYKQINTHMPNVPFTVVQVGDGPKKLEALTKQIALANEKRKAETTVHEISDINKDYIFVPPNTGSSPMVGLMNSKPATTSTKFQDISNGSEREAYTTASSSSIPVSLSANPIVVLPEDRVFSYKQEKGGSSTTVIADKTNKVSVLDETKRDNLDSQRGDIPDLSL